MAEHRLIARVDIESDDKSSFLVRAPTVGIMDRAPKQGIYLNPLEGFAALSLLGRHYIVQLPRGVQGRVTECFIEGRHRPVEYNQPLFKLQLGLDQTQQEERQKAQAVGATAADQELIAVPSPSDGIFYRRPSPDSPAYAEVGSAVSQGSVLGLVEVMKSFNQIIYGGTGLPDRGTVVEIKAEDAVEVRFGQPLFLIKPA